MQVYENDVDLITRLCAIVVTSIRLGDAILIVATAEHRDQLVNKLEKSGIDIRAAVRDGRYVMMEAAELLSLFMRDGYPDAELFRASVGTLVTKARAQAKSTNQGLTVFGEMVAVLWNNGQKEAALALERIWNAALADSTFHLHCAYPRAVFSDTGEFRSVCEVHSHVLQ